MKIELGGGQEKLQEHDLSHVVQQKQGRIYSNPDPEKTKRDSTGKLDVEADIYFERSMR